MKRIRHTGWRRADNLLILTLAAAVLAGCGGKKEEPATESDNSAEVEAWYRAHPEFFVFKKPDDLPAGLKWENGMDLPEIGSPEAKKGGTLNAFMDDFPRTLRTVGPDSNGSFRAYITDTAMNYAQQHPNVGGYFPGLAKEWAIDREHHTVYIRLNPAARWSDGVPVTMDDVFFAFYYFQSPYNNAPWYQDFYTVQYKSITRYDDQTFAITIAESKPDFESYALELGPEPRHFYKGFGKDYVSAYQWKFRPTTGAYIIRDEDIRKGSSITLTRNKDWWAKDLEFWRYRFNPDKLRIEVIRDVDKAFETFARGDLDMFGMNLAKYNYEKLPDLSPLVQKGYIHKVIFRNDIPRSGFGIWMNASKPLLDDVNIRKGLQHAMNWDLVLSEFFRGDWAREQTVADGYGDLTNPDIKAPGYSVVEADESFAKAGFTKRGPDGILMNAGGERLSFNLSTGYSTLADVLTILEREARKAGVELKLEVLDATAGFKKVQEKTHELALTGFSISATEKYPRFWESWHGVNAYEKDGSLKVQTNNLTSTNIPEMNELIDKYRVSESHEEKVQLARRIEQIIHDSAAYIPGAYRPDYRLAFWRWIRWPADFNVKKSETASDYYLHWIDQELRRGTLDALKSGATFPPVIKTYDQYKRE